MSFSNTGLGRRWRWCYRPSVRQRRRRREKSLGVGSCATGWPSIPEIVEVGKLLWAFEELKHYGGQAPGIDEIRYDDIGHGEATEILRAVKRDVLEGRYRPQSTRTVSIPKGDGDRRPLKLGVITDRVLALAVMLELEPRIDKIFLPGSYAYRPGRSAKTLLASLKNTMEHTNRRVIVNEDIRKAFDNLLLTMVMDFFAQVIDDPLLVSLVRTILKGADGECRLLGIDQGCPLSPLVLNLFLHFSHDLPVNRDHHQFWQRYSDNLIYLCQSMSEGHQIRSQAQSLLRNAGLFLKGDGGSKTIIQLDQGGSTQLLGYEISWINGKVAYGMGHEAWGKLAENLALAHSAPNPPHVARSMINGWINHCGPALENGRQPDLSERTLSIARRQGFREIGTEASLNGLWTKSYCNWKALCEEHELALP